MNTGSISIGELPDFCQGEIRLPIPIEFRRGTLKYDERKSIESAMKNLKAIATLTERPDWSTKKSFRFRMWSKIYPNLNSI